MIFSIQMKINTYVYPDLSHAISVPECSAVRRLQSIEIDSNAKWYGYFVSASISTSDTTGGIVYFVRYVRSCKILRCKTSLLTEFTISIAYYHYLRFRS